MVPGVGFQASLDVRSMAVTPYRDRQNRFSAAMHPLTFESLTPRLLYEPKPINRGSFIDQSFTLESSITRNVKLVPVSVGGQEYHSWRTADKESRDWEGFAFNTVNKVRQSGQRDGLSIGIKELPKRFEQMFGEGGANLRVSGYRRITFSGRSQWDDAVASGIRNQSKFPSLNMEQVSRFTIQGTIGSKITVSVSQDNQTDIPLANRLILRYKGDEDDILRSVEAGNTNLSIPNTRFVGYSQRIQGLFGIKAEAQLGNLSFTAIASQEKGSSENAVVSATGEENAEYIRDYSYVEGRIFDLAYPGEIGPRDSVDVWVYEEEVRDDNPASEEVVLQVSDDLADKTWEVQPVRMKEVETDEYELLYGQDTNHCPVAIVFYSSRYRAVAVKMDIIRYDESNEATGEVTHIGYVGDGMDTLRIILPPKDWNPDHPAWQLMWRNCYRIPKNILIDDIDIVIKKGLKDAEEATSNRDYQIYDNVSQNPYIQILGLDQWNNNASSNLKVPDGKVDDRSEVFRSDWGLVIFPEREPFNSSRAFESINSSGQSDKSDTLIAKVPEIYDYFSESERIKASKYFLQLSTKTRSSTISLGRANVIEGSERVTLNGALLTKGTDYNIMYELGQVTLLTPDALDPTADVKVEFQYAPFMTLQKKTLLGMRAEYEYSKDLKFGTTFLYKSDKAAERKPRVGQETAEAMVMDVDGSFAIHPQFITKAVNALPLVSTEAASLFQVSGEIAQSRPNPNVDGAAYIDDFESAVELLSLSIVRTRWTLSSLPLQLDGLDDTWERGTIRWHNPPPVSRDSVYIGDYAAGEGSVNPLRLIFRPHGYSFSGPDDAPCEDSVESRSWGGIMRSFGGIDEDRVQVFEMRAKGGSGIMHFDFGKISEDINGDDIAQDEDTTTNKNGLDYDPENGINEDTGLDGLLDPYEVGPCGDSMNVVTNPDPAHDNWWYEGYGKGAGSDNRPPIPEALWSDQSYRERVNDSKDWLHYEWQNGTEGNVDDQAVQGEADKEALRSGSQDIFDQDNVYFTFELPLSTDDTNEYIVPGSGLNGWYTYRVPVRDPGIIDTVTESPDRIPNWASVDHVRIWFEQDTPGVDSMEAMDSIWIADWGFVQSSWTDTLYTREVSDVQSKFFVASISEQDGFIPPPGVDAYVDKVNNVTEVQRGLSLVFKDLGPGAEGVAQKDLLSTESYTGYGGLDMYVHGDTSLALEDSLMFFLKLGLDSTNYYEYRTFIKAGWEESNYVHIDFDEITALKDAADRALTGNNQTINDSTDVYRVIGRPNLGTVRFLSASIKNLGSHRLYGRKEIWVDELRLTDVRKDVGIAARLDVAGSLADLFSYSVSYEYRDAFFRGLSEATRGGSTNNLGSGEETKSLTAKGTLRLNMFMPRSWQASVPVTVTYSESQTIPLLRTNSDVVLPEAVREEEKSVSKTVKVSVSEDFNRRGSNLLFNALLNRQKIAFSYSRQRRQTVTAPMIFSETYNVRAEMNTGVSKPPTLPIFGWAGSIPILKAAKESVLGLYPNQWVWSANFSRSLQYKDDTDSNRTSSYSRNMDGRMSLGYKIFPSMSSDFSFTTKRDLTDDDLINLSFKNPKLGIENSYTQSFRLNYDPKLSTYLTTAFQYTANYNDTWDRSSESHTTSLTRTWGINGEFRHTALLDRLSHKKGGQRRPARGTIRRAIREDDPNNKEKKKEENKGDGTPIYQPLISGLKFLTGWLSPVRYKYGESFNKSIPGAREKLPMKYRLGLDINGEFPLVETNRNPSAGETINYDLSSGFSFLGGVSATVGYKVAKSRALLSVGSDLTETVTTSWPELTISIRRFDKLPLLKPYVNWFIDIFAPKTSYSRQTKETNNLDRGFVVNWTESINRSPLLNLNLKLWRRLSLSGSYNLTETREERYDRTTGELDVETRSTKKTISVTSKYSFSAPGGLPIPLLGRVKFKSVVNIDATVQYTSELVESAAEGSDFAPYRNNSSFAVSPIISYSFSTQIKGGITARWQDTNDQQNRKKSHVRELQLWTEIRF